MPDELDDNLVIVRRVNQSIGQNNTDEADSIGDDRVELAQNCTVSKKGLIKTRLGATQVADDVGNAKIDGVGVFKKEGSTAEMHMVTGGVWYRRQAGDTTWTSTQTGLSVGARVKFVQAGNLLFMSNGIDNVMTWNGTTVTDEGNTNVDPPKFIDAVYHKNRLFTILDSTINYSDVLGPQTFDRAANGVKPQSQSGSSLVAIEEMSLSNSPGLVVFKGNSSFFLDTSNSTPSNWSFPVIDPIHGCVATHSVSYLGSSALQGGIAYLSKEGASDGANIYRVRSVQLTSNNTVVPGPILSRDIDTTLSALNDSKVSDSACIFFDNKYILAVPSSSSAYNDTICVLDFNISNPSEQDFKWQVFTGWNAAMFAIFDENNASSLYYGEHSADSIVLKAFNGNTDNGTAIVTKITGRAEDFGVPEANKTAKWVEVYFRGTDTSLATVRVIFDDGSPSVLGTVSLTSSGPTLAIDLPFNLAAADRIVAKFPGIDTQISRNFQIEVEHTSGTGGDTMQYLGYTLAAYIENVSYGETK